MSLIEVMVAFGVAALSLVVVVRGSGSGLRAAEAAAQYQDALSRARSHMAGASVTLRPGLQQGDDGGGFDWQVLVTPTLVGRPDLVLYQVRVRVSWRSEAGRRDVTLVSQRLAGEPAPP